MIALSRQELGVVRLALETQERVMTERSRPAAAAAARLVRDKLALEDVDRPFCLECGQALPEHDRG